MIKEFREFLLRGNVVDLAIAVVLGAAFGAVVTSFVNDILMQFIAMIGGEPDFSGLSFTINDAEFRYGAFLNAVISFVIIAAAIFFLVVKPINALMARRKAGLEPEPEAVPEDVVLLGEIRDLLKARP
ncbi:MAG TPA: large conductance mechanosensitive channel protein MscL [Solirubrobacteraceae bacterium]|jgi:large conductance mechanosensitive channel|nr:large conductance mechanosensitive channel protein MscL [Solirubrobacteraceae bacterium]